MAASLYKAQFALRLCEDHNKKELHAYCKTCEKKICSSCIKEDHYTHNWETITDLLRETRRILPAECKEIRYKQLPSLKKELNRFDRKIEEEEFQFKQNKTTLDSSRQSYINEINMLFDDRIDECKHKSEATKLIYKDKREALKQKVEYLEMMTTSLDKDINTLPDHDILDMEKEMKDELKKALSYSADKYTCTTVFVPGQIDVHALENMIGEIHNMSLEEMYDVDKYSNHLFSINPVSKTKAWIRVDQDMYAKLIDREGEVLKTLKITCTDLISSNSGEIVLTSKNKCNISVNAVNEETLRTIDTTPLRPYYISKTKDDDILVSLRDSGDHFNLVSTSRRVVQRMTLTGKVLHTYEFRDDGKTRLFILPTRTAENKNTDVCIVNMLSGESGELVVIHEDGLMNFTYRGDERNSEKFLPNDVGCDSKCHILFTEKYSKAIHMMSPGGMHLCILRQDEHVRTYTFSIFGDSLWCGFKDGTIKVLKYNN